MASSEGANEPVRVIIWMVPRTLSTVFLKSMSNLDRVQIISEPYTCASAFGPERLVKGTAAEGMIDSVADMSSKADMDMGLDHNLYTYKWVKESLLEASYPGKAAVVCKDTAMSIPKEKYDMIPKGFRHAFMIRHPHKLFKSWNKMFAAVMPVGDSCSFSTLLKTTGAPGYGFKELFDLYEYVKESGLENNPVVIDSDDLLIDPEGILRKFCKTTGLQYTDKLLKFEAGDGVVKQWKASKLQLQANKAVYGVYQAAFDSTCFKKPDNMDPPPRTEFSEDLLECIDTSMPYYEKLYAERLTV